MDFSESLKFEIEKYIKENGITKEDFAKNAKIHLNTLNSILNCNIDNIKLHTINKILNFLNLRCFLIKNNDNNADDDMKYSDFEEYFGKIKNSFKI